VRAVLTRQDAARLAQLGEAAARGELVIPIAARFPLARAREAQKLGERGASGKVLLTM
jgi:NADPH:quinone reductase-like Zn-dependent oxidoreductase